MLSSGREPFLQILDKLLQFNILSTFVKIKLADRIQLITKYIEVDWLLNSTWVNNNFVECIFELSLRVAW